MSSKGGNADNKDTEANAGGDDGGKVGTMAEGDYLVHVLV